MPDSSLHTLPGATQQTGPRFGPWLKERRQALDLTQDALAQQAGCSMETIRKIEAGLRRPSRQIAELLAEVLSIPPAERPDFLLWARGLPGGAPPAAPAPAVGAPGAPPWTAPPPTNLPAPITALIGRDEEVATLRALLTRPGRRLITLTGPGGTGKTRLAVQVAHEVLTDSGAAQTFPDGVYFVSLAPVQNPELVIPTIAATLGVKESSSQPLLSALRSYLETKRVLLVLDNFEQVAAAAARLVLLLEDAPRLRALVTSREALRVRGEREFPVPPLALPDLDGPVSPDTLEQSAAVALFVERALDVRPDFRLTAANAAAVAAICRRLDGLPLALELAAARSRTLAPAALLAALAARGHAGAPAPTLDLLTGGYRDLPARQQTLRGAIAWSYDLLPPGEQALFRRLAVFAGGVTLEAIVAVGGGQSTTRSHEGLESLVHKSLLRHVGEAGAERYFLLETIREFALERLLASEEAAQTRQRHALYFLDLAETAESQFTGPQQTQWMDRLERERANVWAALDWAAVTGDAELAQRLAAALGRFWQLRAYWSEGRERLGQALGVPGEVPARVRARALRAAGILALTMADWTAALALLEESLVLFQAIGDAESSAYVLDRLGAAAFDQGDRARGIALYEASLALARQVGYQRGVATALRGLGRAASQMGQTERAVAFHEEALAIFRELADRWGIAGSLSSLGDVAASNQLDYARAVTLYEEALEVFRALGARGFVVDTLSGLAEAVLELGDPVRALALTQEMVALSVAVGSPDGVANARRVQAFIALAEGDYPAALAHARAGLFLVRDLGHTRQTAESLAALAAVVAARGQAVLAAQLAGALAALDDALGSRPDHAEQLRHERIAAAARAVLDPPAFAAAWAAGRALTLDQAVAAALAETDDEL